jgi:hypothetical protein
MEYIFYDDYRSTTFFISLFIGVLVFLTVLQFAHAHADAKLLATIGTLEDQRLSGFILGLVESDVLVTLWAPHTLHTLRPSL